MNEEVKVEVVQEEPKDEMQELIFDLNGPVITVRKLLEAGVHFGHQTRRWNPKMKKYIYTARNGIYIVDLNQTAKLIEESYKALKKIIDNNGKLLFVGTKKQCQDLVKEEALRSGSFYVTHRWLGGTLTNFRTIQKRIRHLKDIEKMEEDGTFDILPKKEVALLRKEGEKLEKTLGGIKEMRKLPNAIFVVDPRIELNAVLEARRLNIPVFGIVDTNSDPDLVDYVIPGNDDATKSVKLLLQVMADAVVESKGGQTTVAYTKDAEAEATMDDVIANADKVEEARQLARKQALELKRQQMAARQNRGFRGNRGPRPERKPVEAKAAEAKVEEVKEEAKVAEAETKTEEVKEEKPAKKPAAKKTAKKTDAKAEEKAAE